MARNFLALLLVLQFLSIGWTQTVKSDQPVKPVQEEAVASARHKRMLNLACGYAFSEVLGGKEVKLRETPLFSWANPEVRAVGGELYLWTVEGRPFATIGIWTYDDVKDSHELQSL